MADSDERQIGRLCILPEDVQDELILTNLRFAEINVNKVRFERWQEPELVENQPWLKYKGRWGEDAKFFGWSGPQNPPISRPPNKNSLKEAIQKGYDGESVVKIWHGIK